MLNVIRFTVPIFFFSLAFPANAQTAQDCAGIDNSADRLACFDNLVQDHEPSDRPSVWQFATETDPMTDTLIAMVSTQSLEPVTDPYGFGMGTHASLGVICSKDNAGIVIHYNTPMVNGIFNATQMMTYRLDADEPKRIRVGASQDMESVHLLGRNEFDQFLDDLMSADEVLVRVENIMGNSTDARFELYGFDDAMERLREYCES